MDSMQYTTVDTIFAKFTRDLKGTELNEGDVIEWIGEALEFLKAPNSQEQAVSFLEVKNHQVKIPEGFQMVLQIAKNKNWSPERKEECIIPIKELEPDVVEIPDEEDCDTCYKNEPYDCKGNPLFDGDCPKYIPYFDMQMQFIPWTVSSYYKQNFVPVRLSNHTFFNSLVCKEKNQSIYQESCEDEYTIVGIQEKYLRFSFKEGYIALAYLKNIIDRETGYPLIPDHISYITAITYYVKWKIAEMHAWAGREGWESRADKAESKWLKYVKQAKSFRKMPKTIDELQNLLEQTHYLIPNHKRYYTFFKDLNKNNKMNFNTFNTRYVKYGEEYN